MKKLLTLIAFICFWVNANAQYVDIPDATFRSFLITKYPSCFDTLSRMDTTCSDILNEKKLYYDVHVGNVSTGGPGTFSINIKGIKYFKNLDSLIYLHSLPPFPALDALTDLPQNLKYLNVNLPDINYVGVLPNSLNEFDFKVLNSFTKSITLPQNLQILRCSNVMSSCFSYLPNSIEHLEFTNSLSTALPTLPLNLKYLNCSSNRLDCLPNLSLTLEHLECSDNLLNSLPTLPNSLKRLLCNFDRLPNLPVLPNNLIELNCDSNFSIKRLPNLPSSLKDLRCSFNLVDSLPELPKSLKTLTCFRNLLSKLPSLPDSLIELNCSGNLIECLPLLPSNLLYLYSDYSYNIFCVPNYPTNCTFYNYSNHQVYPSLCNPLNNASQCQPFTPIITFVYTDNNSNNKLDFFDAGKPNIKLTLSNNKYSYTNTQGITQVSADSLGTYTITAQAPPLYKAVPASYTHTFNSYDTLVMDTFALQPTVIKDSLTINITPLNWAARPGFKYVYEVACENVGTTIVNTNCNVVVDTSKYIFDSTNNAAINFSGNTLSYSVNNFVPGQTNNFLVYGRVKSTAVLGSNLQATASITGGSATAVDTANTIVRGSFDPNDKQATPQLSLAQVADNKHWIDYTIRFENTGTDTAFTVVVADTLDNTKLQTNTLQLTSLSHNCKVSQNDNIVYFEFLNINLPDSNTNKTACNGFVNFRVKPLTTLIDGNIVPNKASIYFDYNSPIHTNTANTIIGSTLPLSLTALGAIPKPENNTILVYWNTANEINTNYFIIEQSTDARAFKAAAEVAAIGKGNNSYYYNIAKNNVQYIRLKMVYKNGSYSYSNIIRIPVDEKRETIVIQSPAKGVLKINVLAAGLHNTKASLINNEGKVVKTFTLKQGYQTIDIAALPSGLYYVQASDVVRKVAVSS